MPLKFFFPKEIITITKTTTTITTTSTCGKFENYCSGSSIRFKLSNVCTRFKQNKMAPACMSLFAVSLRFEFYCNLKLKETLSALITGKIKEEEIRYFCFRAKN